MYLKDKSQRITLRLNEEQFGYVKQNADILGVSPSEFLRMVVNASMSAYRKMEEKVNDALNERNGGNGRENDKAYQHNIV